MKKSNIKAGRNISKTATAEASKSCMPDEFQGMARCASGERTERSQTYVSTPSPDAQQRQPLKVEGNKSFKPSRLVTLPIPITFVEVFV